MVRGAGPGGVQAAGADTPGHQLLGDQESVPAAGAAAEPGGQPGHGHSAPAAGSDTSSPPASWSHVETR